MAKKPSLPKGDIQIGFDKHTITLKIDQIVRLKTIPDAVRTSKKFAQIVASIREIGIIEPPAVAPDTTNSGQYFLLDGHLRIEALKELGETEVVCLVSRDDESFTYNKHISRLSPVQENKMILKAIERGVSEDRIAAALNIDIHQIRQKRDLLKGICDEAIDLLKDKMVPASAFPLLKQMKPFRQIEAAILMNDGANYSVPYVRALLASSSRDQLIEEDKTKKVKGLSVDQMNRMETEMVNLQREYRMVQDRYTADVFNLTLTKGYLSLLLSNARVVRYLNQNHGEYLTEFRKIVDMTSISKDLLT